MQPSTTRVLSSLRDIVARSITPACTTPESARAVALLETSLAHLVGRQPGDPSRWLPRLQRLEQLIDRGLELAGEPPITSRVAALDIVTWGDYEEREFHLQGRLADLARRIAGHLDPAGEDVAARAWLREVVADECERALPPPCDTMAASAAPIPGSEAVQAYFAERLAGGKPLGDFEFGTIAGGYSRSTYTVSAMPPDASARAELVVRLAGPEGLMDGVALSLAAERAVIEFAGRSGVPVATPQWVEEDAAVLGGQFLVTQRVSGKPLGTAVDSGTLPLTSLRQAGAALANLHTGQWWSAENAEVRAVLGVEPDLDLRTAFEKSIERWRGFIAQPHINPSPALQASVEWLAANFPDRDLRPALVHGDVGFHNMLFDGENLSALLDWELADIGDPARDLVAMRRQIADPAEWEAFLAAYVEAGGPPVDDEVLGFYEVWLAVLSTMTMVVAAENRFAIQSPPRSEYLELGLMFKPHFLNQLRQYTDAAWSATA